MFACLHRRQHTSQLNLIASAWSLLADTQLVTQLVTQPDTQTGHSYDLLSGQYGCEHGGFSKGKNT